MSGPWASPMDVALAALKDLTRRDILLRFYADPTPKTAIEVAQSAGIHRSVAFDHLERLVALGYLATEPRRGFRGKPAKLYSLAQGPIMLSHPPRQWGLLAQALAGALDAMGPTGLAAAHEAGRTLAQTLVPSAKVDSLSGALQPLESLGADYDLSKRGLVVARNCLFHEACVRSPAVRRFHAGLLEGLLEPVRPGVGVEEVPGGAVCQFRLLTEVSAPAQRASMAG
ncbi:MAG TPA: helix-turn-helix domain-containing protein [Candidatus Dormibacteraeota bacterium]